MKKFKLLALSGIILGVIFVSKTTKTDSTYSNVELKNIEALANSEIDYDDKSECFKAGSVECVNGGYSEIILIYKLDKVILSN